MEFGFSTLAQSARAYTATTSIELMLFGGIFLLMLAWGLAYGKYRLSTLIISLYAGLTPFLLFPYIDSVPWNPGLLFNKIEVLPVVLFAVLVFFIYFTLVPIIECQFSRVKIRRWFEAAVLSLSTTITLTASLYYIGISQTIIAPQSLLDSLFLEPVYLFWWFLIPLVGLYITKDS